MRQYTLFPVRPYSALCEEYVNEDLTVSNTKTIFVFLCQEILKMHHARIERILKQIPDNEITERHIPRLQRILIQDYGYRKQDVKDILKETLKPIKGLEH